MSLDGRVAIVTGAAGGLGSALTRDLAAAGVRLGLVGTRLDRLEDLAAELRLPPDRWLAQAVDLRRADLARAAVGAVVERFGRLDIVAHLVGGWTGGSPATETPAADFASMLDQHFWTTLHVVQAAVPAMRTGRWGRFVAVSSPVAAAPTAKMAAYAVGKSAEETLLASVAAEVAGSGITANVILVRAIAAAPDADAPSDLAETARRPSQTTPQQIVAAIRYLCTDEAGAINGARLPLY